MQLHERFAEVIKFIDNYLGFVLFQVSLLPPHAFQLTVQFSSLCLLRR